MKIIEVNEVTYVTKETYKLPKRNSDGCIIYKNGKDSSDESVLDINRIPIISSATQVDILYILPLQINNLKGLPHGNNDGLFASKLYSAIFRYYDSQDKSKFELHDKVYAWVFRVLNRVIKDKDNGDVTLARRMFGVSDTWILEQLKDIDTRKKSLDDIELPDSD